MARKRAIKHLMYAVQRGECFICKEHMPWQETNLDHIIPKSLGGPNNKRNVILTHKKCNSRRQNLLYSKAAEQQAQQINQLTWKLFEEIE